MGRQEGLIQLSGGVGNLSFYKSQDGYLVRKKSGVSRKRIMSDPAYARTRENIAEFRRGALATKLLRSAFRSFIRTAADNRVTSRLTSAIMKVIKSDAISARGQRNVTNGEVALLEGFGFNKNAALAKTFSTPFTASIDRATGTMIVDIPAFSPANVISAPEGATHFRLRAAGAAIDFEGNTCSVAASESTDLPISQEVQGPLQLSQTVAPASVNPLFVVFGVEFLQLVNGVQYPLTNGMFNAMAIVTVDNALSATPVVHVDRVAQHGNVEEVISTRQCEDCEAVSRPEKSLRLHRGTMMRHKEGRAYTVHLAGHRLSNSRVTKLIKFETKTEDLGTAELRSNLHKIVDQIEDERLLNAIYSFLNERENSEEGKMWTSLTGEQKKEVLQSYDESEDV